MTSSRMVTVLAGTLALVLAVGGCTGSSDTGGSSGAALPAAGPAQRLVGACPNPLVMQTDWNPEAEHGYLYSLVGPGYTIDAAKKRVTGPLVAAGKDAGVKIEVRMGGPSVGYQPMPAVLYTDRSVHLGYAATDEAVQFSAQQPITAVIAPTEISPLAILWSPDVHPEFHTIADIGRSNTKVLYTQGPPYMDYLVGSGLLHRSQLDGSYDGSPDRFVSERGQAALEGFVTAEPYLYEHEIKQWGKPLTGQLIHDTGYPAYISALSVRSGDRAKLAPCLKRLVPILQQSQVDFTRDPEPAIRLILHLVEEYKTGWVYPRSLAEFSAQQQVQRGIISNGTDKTLGNFDLARVQRVIDIVEPIFAAQHKPTRPGLEPQDIVTNEFIDPKIGLP
jgi:hypothetical protein